MSPKIINTRPVEMGVYVQGPGEGGSWFLDNIDIPADTQVEQMDAVAIAAYKQTEFARSGDVITAHIFVYHVPSPDDFWSDEFDEVCWDYEPSL